MRRLTSAAGRRRARTNLPAAALIWLSAVACLLAAPPEASAEEAAPGGLERPRQKVLWIVAPAVESPLAGTYGMTAASGAIGEARGFYRVHFLPRVTSELRPFEMYPYPGSRSAEQHGDLLDDRMTRKARGGVERAALRAIRDYLIERSSLDRALEKRLDALPFDSRGSGEGPNETAVLGQGRSSKVSIGIVHFLPWVEVRRDLKRGAVGVGVGALGTLDIDFERGESMRFRASFDRDNSIRLALRIGIGDQRARNPGP